MAKPLLRLAIGGLCIALALAAAAQYASWRETRSELEAILDATGILDSHPSLAADIRRAPGFARSRLRVARALLARELDRRFGGEEVIAGDAQPPPLATARELARVSLERQPASWQAALVLGGATYLEVGRRRDSARSPDTESWTAPLQLARRLAPGQPEPARLLAAASLGEWSRLDEDERQAAAEVVAAALRDPRSFDLLVAYWLRVAPNLERALAAIPDAAWAWDRLGNQYANNADWERFAEVHNRWRRALENDLGARLETARRMASGGERRGARERARSILGVAPPSHEFRAIFAGALDLLRLESVDRGYSAPLRDWLLWSLDRCRENRCPFAAADIELLFAATSALAPAERAQAAIAASRLDVVARAEAALHPSDPAAIDFYVLKGRWMAQRGDLRAALEALATPARVPPTRVGYWRQLAEIQRLADNPRAAAAANTTLQSMAAARWPGHQFRKHYDTLRLELHSAADADGLRLRWGDLAAGGGAVAIRWDGRVVGTYAVGAGIPTRIEIPVERGVHLIEVLPVRGRLPAVSRLDLG